MQEEPKGGLPQQKAVRWAALVVALILLVGLLRLIWSDNRIPDRQTPLTPTQQQP